MIRLYSFFNLQLLLCFVFVAGCGTLPANSEPGQVKTPRVNPSINQAKNTPAAQASIPEPSTGKSKNASEEMITLFVTSDKAILRECPATRCNVVTVLKRGEEVIKTGMKNDWTNIRTKTTNHEGWVASRLLGKKQMKKAVTQVKNRRPAPKNQKPVSKPLLEEEFSP